MSSEILTSTGREGVSRRSYHRLYVNGKYTDDPDQLGQNFRRLCDLLSKYSNRVSRVVSRGVVGQNAMQHIYIDGLSRNLEVVLPLNEFTGDNTSLIYLAQNSPERISTTSLVTLIKSTCEYTNGIQSPINNINRILSEGLLFSNVISENQITQLQTLWGNTFGWTRQEIENLKLRLETSRSKPPSERDVWLSMIQKDGEIISAVMAERLTLQGEGGRRVDLVESTEWVTKNGYTKNGYITAAVNYLTAQILFDHRDSPNGLPIIFAECNFASRADIPGHKAGFKIPDRTNTPQVLVQNVSIEDGLLSNYFGKYRDFLFMYLPVIVIEQNYSPQQVNEITNLLKPKL